jgi:hypothetical protein
LARLLPLFSFQRSRLLTPVYFCVKEPFSFAADLWPATIFIYLILSPACQQLFLLFSFFFASGLYCSLCPISRQSCFSHQAFPEKPAK